MDIEQFYNYCLNKKGTIESFPFDQDTLVFKVLNKMYALTSLQKWEAGDHSVNLKCHPEKALQLREEYQAVKAAYHMNKTHWNTVAFNQDVPDKMLLELIDHSYDLVVAGMPKKEREMLKNID